LCRRQARGISRHKGRPVRKVNCKLILGSLQLRVSEKAADRGQVRSKLRVIRFVTGAGWICARNSRETHRIKLEDIITARLKFIRLIEQLRDMNAIALRGVA